MKGKGSCPVGQYRDRSTPDSIGVCKACTNRVSLSHYTGDGGFADECPWQCRATWPIPGPWVGCVLAFFINRVFVVLLMICFLVGGTVAVRSYVKPRETGQPNPRQRQLMCFSREKELKADYQILPCPVETQTRELEFVANDVAEPPPGLKQQSVLPSPDLDTEANRQNSIFFGSVQTNISPPHTTERSPAIVATKATDETGQSSIGVFGRWNTTTATRTTQSSPAGAAAADDTELGAHTTKSSPAGAAVAEDTESGALE